MRYTYYAPLFKPIISARDGQRRLGTTLKLGEGKTSPGVQGNPYSTQN